MNVHNHELCPGCLDTIQHLQKQIGQLIDLTSTHQKQANLVIDQFRNLVSIQSAHEERLVELESEERCIKS